MVNGATQGPGSDDFRRLMMPKFRISSRTLANAIGADKNGVDCRLANLLPRQGALISVLTTDYSPTGRSRVCLCILSSSQNAVSINTQPAIVVAVD